MLARLGYVLEFIGMAIAGILCRLALITSFNTPTEAWPGVALSVVLTMVVAFLAWLIGWTLRYILAGPTPKKAKGG